MEIFRIKKKRSIFDTEGDTHLNLPVFQYTSDIFAVHGFFFILYFREKKW